MKFAATIDSEMSGSKARHSTVKARARSRLDVATNGDTARKNACATPQERSESFVWDSLLGLIDCDADPVLLQRRNC